ncbi:hypothetical protein BT93_D1320 [Corymbia citriodora subsp. variegata]|nr:hypothetical protein BT93_D1320 [Corymbia citriodora subsp. variegata]
MHPTIFLISMMGLFVAPSLAHPPSVCLLCHVPPRDMSSLGAIPASRGPIFITYHHQTPLGVASWGTIFNSYNHPTPLLAVVDELLPLPHG